MSVEYIGELTLAAAVPGPMSLLIAAQSQLQAQVTATLAMQATVTIPTTLAQLIAMAEQILASLAGMLAQGLQPPTISLQLSIIASTVAALELQLAPYLALGAVAATGGVFGYVYDGSTAGAGSELSVALAGGFPGYSGSAHCNLLVLGCVSTVTWSAMQVMFKTSP